MYRWEEVVEELDLLDGSWSLRLADWAGPADFPTFVAVELTAAGATRLGSAVPHGGHVTRRELEREALIAAAAWWDIYPSGPEPLVDPAEQAERNALRDGWMRLRKNAPPGTVVALETLRQELTGTERLSGMQRAPIANVRRLMDEATVLVERAQAEGSPS